MMLAKGLLKEYSRAISFVMRIMDMCIVLMAGMLAYFLRFNHARLPFLYWVVILLGLMLTPVLFSFFRIYESMRGISFFQHVMILLRAVCAMSLVLLGIAFFTQTGASISRIWFVYWMILILICLVIIRLAISITLRFMRKHGLNERRVVILGAGEQSVRLAAMLQQASWTGFRLIAFLDDHLVSHRVIQGVTVIQTPHDLGNYLSQEAIDEFWIALPLSAEVRVKEVLFELRHHTHTTRLMLDIFGLDLLNHSITDMAGIPLLNIRSSPMVGVNRMIKAFEDRMLATLILLVISPLFCLIALGVKLSSKGPVLFKQHRLGWDGRIIKIYKFRTMYEHIEQDGWITQATAEDTRVTSLGRILRRLSLDELPQFINVLQGRMSIVGPRPHALAHNEFYKNAIQSYMQRYHVKPGITGWAQVSGWRGETNTLAKMEKRIEYDLYYINNWSLAFDLKIILLTICWGFFGRNAY